MTTRRRAAFLCAILVAALATAACATLGVDSTEALLKQGIELFTARRYDEAIAKFQEVIRRDPRAWNAYLYLARSYVAKASWADAIASGRKALELAPNRADVVPVLAEAFLGAGTDALTRRQFSDAIGFFGEYVKLRPTDFQGYLNLARAFLGTSAWLDALTSGRKAFELAPNRGEVLGLLAEALLGAGTDALARGQFAAAIGHFVEYVKLKPTDFHGYLNLARAFVGTRAWGDAIASGRKALELAPSAGEGVGLLAQALLSGGLDALQRRDFSTAATYLTEYVTLRPADVQGYLNLGRAFLGTGAYADALRTLVQGLPHATDAGARSPLIQALLDGGNQALAAGNAKAAAGLLQEYVRYDPASVSAYLNLGKAYWQEGNLGNALSAFRRVLELNPSNAEALQFLGGRR